MRPIKSGLIAAPFTPLSADGEINLHAIPEYAAHLVEDGAVGAFICGTTGEGSTLDERMRVAEAWRAACPEGFKIIVHVGQNAVEDCKILSRHAQDVGADGIATLAPSFFRTSTMEDLLEWCAPIAAAAPKVPFYYYHMPAMTGADVPMAQFLPQAERRIPTFAGIKFTHENLMDFHRTLDAAADRYAVLAGRDEILLSYLAVGAQGAVGSTYNYASPIFLQLIAAQAAGDFSAARKWQVLACSFIGVIQRFGGLPANKAIMGIVSGIDCGPVRVPLRKMDAARAGRLRSELEASGIFEGLAEAKAAHVP